MLWDGLVLLGLLAGVLGVRPLALWVARFGWGLSLRLYERAGQTVQDERVRSVVAAARSRLPGLTYWVEARLTPCRFPGLALTLIVISVVYLLGLFAGLIEELVDGEEETAKRTPIDEEDTHDFLRCGREDGGGTNCRSVLAREAPARIRLWPGLRVQAGSHRGRWGAFALHCRGGRDETGLK